jgi:hypothetical protein
MKLADRPAYHLARLMSARAISSQYALGEAVWPELARETSRGRVRNMLAGHMPAPELLEQVAAWFEVDPGEFYALPPEGEGS